MNWTKITENKTFLLSLWVIVCFGLFVNGINSFISSSEFWSIYLSQKIFSFDPGWSSVYLKPLFHLLLSSIYLLNLNDFYHIYAVKILFSLNGVLQFFLIYKILQKFRKDDILNFFLVLCLFCSPMFLKNYDRIRSDQVALTLFLAFVYISQLAESKTRFFFQVSLFLAFPFLAFKHFYFSILTLPLVWHDKSFLNNFRKIKIARLNFILLFLSVTIWSLYLGWPALHYFIESLINYSESLSNLKQWARNETLYIYLSFVPYFFISHFSRYLKDRNLISLLFTQLLCVILILVHPQKFDFFIASFLPLLYFPIALFCHYLRSEKSVSLQFLLILLFGVSIFSVYLTNKKSVLITTNNPQLIAIDRISTIITKNRLTYIDGAGILPKAKNLGCFVSPDDTVSNLACITSIKNTQPDALILTNRLMALGSEFDFNKLESFGYISIGPNVFLKKDLKNVQIPYNDWPPPSLIFTTNQIY